MLKTDFKEILSSQLFKTVSETADELGLETYVIGGFVRDHLLDRKRKNADIDFVVIGSGIELAQEVQKRLAMATKVQVFKTYGTAMLRHDDIEIEFVGARKESYSENSRNPAVENGSLEDDQNRRDFTINALALNLSELSFGDLLDPFNGIEDLENIIRKLFLSGEVNLKDQTYVSNSRHIAKLRETISSLNDSIKAIGDELPIDMVEMDLKEAWYILGEIIGDTSSTSLIDELFSKFLLFPRT